MRRWKLGGSCVGSGFVGSMVERHFVQGIRRERWEEPTVLVMKVRGVARRTDTFRRFLGRVIVVLLQEVTRQWLQIYAGGPANVIVMGGTGVGRSRRVA